MRAKSATARFWSTAASGWPTTVSTVAILLLNRRAVQNLGGSDSGQFVGKYLTELFGEEAGAAYVERIRKTAASPEPLEYLDFVELPIGPRWLASIHTRSLDSAGNVVGVHVYAQDITELKQAEEGFRRSSELLSRGENLAHSGAGSGTWPRASPRSPRSGSACTASAASASPTRRSSTLCHADDREAVQAAVERAVAGEPYRVDHRIVLPETHEVRHLMTYGEPRYRRRGPGRDGDRRLTRRHRASARR